MFTGKPIIMKNLLIAISVAIIISANLSSSYGKRSPDKIIIFQGRLSSFELTDTKTLKAFDPWNGQFVDWAKGVVATPSDQSQSCKVFFYAKWPGRRSNYDRGDLKMVYAVIYVPGRDGLPGCIYLPGPGEEFFPNNSGTILREHEDGKWHQASTAWDAVMNRLLNSGAKDQ